MTDEIYKLARPLFLGATVEILSGVPQNVANCMVRDMLGGLPQFKGQVVVGNPVLSDSIERTQDFLADERAMEPFIFWVYDIRTTGPHALKDRLTIAEQMIITCGPCIQYVDHELIDSPEKLQPYIQKVVRDNYFPGIVLREPYGTFGTYDEEIPKESLKLQ